ncbi:MAG: hypothetical protein HKN96_09945 [Flavobacteriaceae bacterium]|nr:hypothetical protein [Bacteroidia bacterium]NND11523.1 hypothetical protein [Flavobacteriaceae bacterium]NNL60614.1 hypothetical protein [Flavobacteriaceae bacterium]
MSKKLPETNSESGEVDLGQLFKMIGSAFERLFSLIGNLLYKLFLSFVWLVFFVRKHFIKLVIAAALTFVLAMIKDSLSDPIYKSSAIIKQNYPTGENLYDLVDYYNALISRKDSTSLAEALGIPQSSTLNLVSFDVDPMVGENVRIKNYDDYLKSLDSSLSMDIGYEKYIENTQRQDYNLQKVSIRTINTFESRLVFQRIVKNLNSSDYFTREQEKDINELENERSAILRSLEESDSLQETYKKILEQPLDEINPGSQTSITIQGQENKLDTKEYELYNNDLALRRELVKIERKLENKKQIAELISSELSNGVIDDKIEILNLEMNRNVFYAILVPILLLLILLSAEFMRYLGRYKDKVQ